MGKAMRAVSVDSDAAQLMGMTPGIKAFVAAVLGGIGIIPGAALGGFVIGLLETFATARFSSFKKRIFQISLCK